MAVAITISAQLTGRDPRCLWKGVKSVSRRVDVERGWRRVRFRCRRVLALGSTLVHQVEPMTTMTTTLRAVVVAALCHSSLGLARVSVPGQARATARRLSLAAVGGFGGSATRVDPAVAKQALSFFIDDKVEHH